ncbi:MAG: hybrid sensor histidine kinase/response regulator [Sneathiella sp.]|uniref:hybrid sensor histidine kinase/response regulator n=1 Tax=Sneathiella sp. TaxID=1964365 RepID=UPI000C59C4EF|nr:PAS domain-containing sensor histidine kinase [Sneathiella sp.]MAZ02562.1 hybrid sensor histidine kinase/response regulator [Sneathiella sp.]
MQKLNSRRRRNPKFSLGMDARQLAAAFFLLAALIVISALLGQELGLVNIVILSAMVIAAMGIGLWYLIFHGLRQAASGNLELLSDIISTSPEGRLLTTKDGRFVYANDAYFSLLELSQKEQRQTLADYFAPDAEAGEKIDRLLKTAVYEGTTGGRIDIETKTGRWLSILAHTMEVMPDNIIWYITETTRQHRLEEDERIAREKLSEYFNNAPVGFYSLDGEGKVQFANRIFADWLGYQQEELTDSQIAFTDLVAKINENQLDLMEIFSATGPLYEGELTLRRRDGTLLPVHVTQTIVRDDGGTVLGSRSVVRELLQEQEWRERVANAELHFRRFFEAAPIGILLLDSEGIVKEVNPAFRALTGSVINKAIGAHITTLVQESDHELMRQKLVEASASDMAAPSIEVKLLGTTERAASFYISAIAGEDPGTGRLLVHVIDTSAQRNLEVQFAQSQKMQAVGQLAGGIAHDFNNLLTAMIGFCDLLLLRHQVGDPSYSDINQIKQNANRAAGLVRQLLAFSRQQTLRPEVTDLTDVLAELSNLLRRLIGEAIQLKINHARDLWLVKVDRGQFEQVIINLAVNARDAMAGDGLLTFETENVTVRPNQKEFNELIPPGDYSLVRVSDTGTGIPKEVIGKIFDPFFTTKKVGEGTGLGLSTVYGIIKQTGGFIFAENNEDGKGTTFSIYLPRHVEAAKSAENGDALQQPVHRDLTGKGTILLVEDEDPVRLFAARALENKGYTVLQADCGEMALEVAHDHEGEIDLLITDVVMPVMDGPTLVKNILGEKPDLKVVFISGYAEDAFRKDLDFDVSKIDFLPKPFSLKEIATKVKEVLVRD